MALTALQVVEDIIEYIETTYSTEFDKARMSMIIKLDNPDVNSYITLNITTDDTITSDGGGEGRDELNNILNYINTTHSLLIDDDIINLEIRENNTNFSQYDLNVKINSKKIEFN